MGKFSTFFLGRLRGCGYAIRGSFLLLRTEPSIQVQFVIALVMIALGFYVGINKTEWSLLVG